MTQRSPDGMDIILPDRIRTGAFANSFRIVQDTGEEVFLDFCVFSDHEKQAVVVARVRVHKTMLNTIRERLNEIVQPQVSQEQPPPLPDSSGRTLH